MGSEEPETQNYRTVRFPSLKVMIRLQMRNKASLSFTPREAIVIDATSCTRCTVLEYRGASLPFTQHPGGSASTPHPTRVRAEFLLVSLQATKESDFQSSNQSASIACTGTVLCTSSSRALAFQLLQPSPKPPQQKSFLSLVTPSFNLRTAPPTAGRRTVGGTR